MTTYKNSVAFAKIAGMEDKSAFLPKPNRTFTLMGVLFYFYRIVVSLLRSLEIDKNKSDIFAIHSNQDRFKTGSPQSNWYRAMR